MTAKEAKARQLDVITLDGVLIGGIAARLLKTIEERADDGYGSWKVGFEPGIIEALQPLGYTIVRTQRTEYRPGKEFPRLSDYLEIGW